MVYWIQDIFVCKHNLFFRIIQYYWNNSKKKEPTFLGMEEILNKKYIKKGYRAIRIDKNNTANKNQIIILYVWVLNSYYYHLSSFTRRLVLSSTNTRTKWLLSSKPKLSVSHRIRTRLTRVGNTSCQTTTFSILPDLPHDHAYLSLIVTLIPAK